MNDKGFLIFNILACIIFIILLFIFKSLFIFFICGIMILFEIRLIFNLIKKDKNNNPEELDV